MMRMALDDPIAAPSPPDGVAIRTFDPARDARAVYDTLMEAFADHWGSEPWTFERWRHIEVDGSDLDGSLWFLAVDGDEIAGVALCSPTSLRRPDTAVVKELAVRRPWRRRGLGLALLLTAFRTFADRGIAHVELGVDSENLTGATRLYARAGMTPAFSWEFWSKAVTA
jgi:ribosomal protein S18 acetylase RimI-like enzyme